MKAKTVLIALASVVVLSSCTKTPEPSEESPLSFSILGDSYSSFKGTVDPETNDVWCYDTIGVTNAEQMWWHKVATKMEWTLDKNNSFSGSLICNYWDFNAGSYYKPHSFINRMDNLGDPDVIFVFGGTNDVWNGAYHGEYVYSDWTESQLEQYKPALAYLFENLKQLYPKAIIYFMIDTSLTGFDHTGQLFVESAHTIARHYGIDCIDLHDIHKEWAHPDAKGQNDIAEQVIDYLESESV
ncbi:MAG: hypothetical protein IJK78_01455 [Bacteroidales bacterium]|nr:hypothetical protein [Bacteroidales bacterium]